MGYPLLVPKPRWAVIVVSVQNCGRGKMRENLLKIPTEQIASSQQNDYRLP